MNRLWISRLGRFFSVFVIFSSFLQNPSSVAARNKIFSTQEPVSSTLYRPALTGIAAIAAGGLHTCALTQQGAATCWGDNVYGQLGNGGSGRHRSYPTDVNGLTTGVISITAGPFHTCALTTSGGVKCWGDNSYGQLGDGSTMRRLAPVDVFGLTSGVQAISAGNNSDFINFLAHTCALTVSGGVKCWGDNTYGQLGNGTNTASPTPVDVIGLDSGVISIAAGGLFTCALTASGGVSCWGRNTYGQLGDGTTTSRSTPADVDGLTSGVSAIAAGGYHACALTVAGGVKCWGKNETGQLGDGTDDRRKSPVDVIGLSSGIKAISAGVSHTCALNTLGGMVCWGENLLGQLGDGTDTDRWIPVNVSGLSSAVVAIAAGGLFYEIEVYAHTCALNASGGVKCWGYNDFGELGDGSQPYRSIPMDVHDLEINIQAVAPGGRHTCALTNTAGVKCWGLNSYGQLGDGTSTSTSLPVDVSGLAGGVSAIASGGRHTCALTATGAVKCWGRNNYGQLGDGTNTNRSTPVAVSGLSAGVAAIEAGYWHTCAILTSGGVKCWGLNEYGQLGDGTIANRSTPVNVSGMAAGVLAVTADERHTCGLTSTGGVKCWGQNLWGQLGDGTTLERHEPVDVLGLSSGVTALATGTTHTCAVTSSGGVKCWGNNDTGQLGDGTGIERHLPVDVTALSGSVTAIAAGGDAIWGGFGWFLMGHTCARISNGGVQCWGNNEDGHLGDGTTHPRSAPVNVSGLAANVSVIAAGRDHSCGIAASGRLKCWGDDLSGQLGLGRVKRSPQPIDVLENSPYLTINDSHGQPGSIFTITGENYPSAEAATVSINGQVITDTLTVNATGGFIYFIDTSEADEGVYMLTTGVDLLAGVSFHLDVRAPVHEQEGGGLILHVPAGIAFDNFTFMPLVNR